MCVSIVNLLPKARSMGGCMGYSTEFLFILSCLMELPQALHAQSHVPDTCGGYWMVHIGTVEVTDGRGIVRGAV